MNHFSFSTNNFVPTDDMRRYLPREFSDWVAFTFTTIMMHVIGFFELLVVLPYIDGKGSEAYWIHVALGWILYVNSAAALVMCITAETGSGSVVLPSILKAGWRFCSSCEANAPPRSFHCWVCRKCVLSRDHHCVFTGNCIGHSNRRYFLLFLFYVWLAATYSTFLHFDYVIEMLHGFSWQALFTMLAPMISWMAGSSSAIHFPVAFLSSSTLIASLLVGGLLCWHLMNVTTGQTAHERAKGCHDYDLGWRRNVEQVFGKNWTYAWITPFIPSPLPTNGIEPPSKASGEIIKDM